jgi:hypothetical protein
MVIPPAAQIAQAKDRLRPCCVSIAKRGDWRIPFYFRRHSLCPELVHPSDDHQPVWMMSCASWRVIVPPPTAVFRAVSVLSFTLAPTSDGGKVPREVNGVPGIPHISGHRFFAFR